MIILSRRSGIWYARFTGERARAVRRLFYTDILPTPFGAVVPADQVAGVIRELNPEDLVLVQEEGGRGDEIP